jgi:DNA primase
MTIEELKEIILIEEVLGLYGAQVGARGGWQEWTPIDCPFCSDSNGSASVNRKAGLFICHQCGAPDRPNGKAGDIVDVAKFGESIRETKDAIEWLQRTFTT